MAQDQAAEKASKSVGAIVGLVLGILALLTSLLPIINNMSFAVGLIGIVFSLIGMVGCLRGKKSGKVLAIVAVLVNVVALVLVLASQSVYSSVLDKVTSGEDVVSVSSSDDADTTDDTDDSSDDTSSGEWTDLAVGTMIKLESGLTVTVDAVQTGLVNYDGSTVTGVQVTYTNTGEDEASFNVYDWKGEDANGVQTYSTYYSESTDDLSSGTLAAGGTVTGSLYFDGDAVRVLYYSSLLSSSATATWSLQ